MTIFKNSSDATLVPEKGRGFKQRYWTKKEDFIVTALFNLVSTEKLSVLMGISTKSIVARKKYLENLNKNGQFKR